MTDNDLENAIHYLESDNGEIKPAVSTKEYEMVMLLLERILRKVSPASWLSVGMEAEDNA